VQDAQDKTVAWERLRRALHVTPEECAHIGDDLPDNPLLAACGVAATVPHAPPIVRAHAHYVTTCAGGAGAVREFADLLLAAQGHGDDVAPAVRSLATPA
jgi:3-deoxy-D-manno-octulosonate 8-phosphate phosphatase (KDO 8-P phosphatase)